MKLGMSASELKEFVELRYPKGTYEGKIIKAEDRLASTDREFIMLTIEIQETIPAEQEIDETEFLNPLGKQMVTCMMGIKDDDKKGTISMFQKAMSDLIKFSEAEITGEDIVADNFLNCYVGVVIGDEKVNKDDPNSAKRSVISGFCAMPE